MMMPVTMGDPADAAFQAYGWYAWNADEIGERELLAAWAIERAWTGEWKREDARHAAEDARHAAATGRPDA